MLRGHEITRVFSNAHTARISGKHQFTTRKECRY